MDSSNQSMNGSYMQYNNGNNFDASQFYNDMQNFTNGNNDAQPQYDPALFDMPEMASFPQQNQQQQQPSQSNYGQTVPQRQSQSPAMPQFKSPPPQSYGSQQYGHNVYDQRNLQQQSFDPHLMSRPSASPGPYDRYSFQQPMNFGNSAFDPRFIHYQHPQQPQSTTPTQSFSQQTPQASHQYMNIAARPPSQSSQYQQLSGMPYGFQQNQPVSHRFIDPSMLSAGNNIQPTVPDAQPRQIQPSPYFPKSSSTIDPRTLQQQMQLPNQIPPIRGNIQASPSVPPGAVHGQYMQLQLGPQPTDQIKPVADAAAPKKPKLKVKKDGSASSDDDLEITNPSEPKPSILVNPKPLDQRGRLVYEIVEAVWSDRNNIAPAEKIRSAIASFGDTVRGLRDGWKAQNEQLKKAEIPNSPSAANAVALKSDVERHREMMHVVMNDAFNLGHPSVLKRQHKPNQKSSDWSGDAIGARGSVLYEMVRRLCQKPFYLIDSTISSPSLNGSSQVSFMLPFLMKYTDLFLRLGENQFTMSALYSFLLDRVNADDYNSELVRVILRLAAKFDTIDEEQLERVKWTKILTRFSKKSTNESKDFALKIISNAKAASAKKKADQSSDGPGSPSAGPNGKAAGAVAGVKRSLEGEGTSQPVTKKAVVKPSSKPLSVQIAERRKQQEKENAAKAAKAKEAEKSTLNSAQLAAKAKAAAAQTKVSPFASLKSASKKSGTTNAERAAATAKDKVDISKPAIMTTAASAVKRDGQKIDSPPQTKAAPAVSSSSFLGYLADMDKPKEAQPKKVEEVPNETPEQKEKRLRKESRRRLRVSWKPDNDLVQTKVFEHDPDEETGHEDSMMKDAGDTVREGEMLKRHYDKDEMDEDDEEDIEDTYSTPSEVDFEVIDAESRNGNFVKCGGPLTPESASSEAQAKHEEGNLMTMYTPTEQPDTPKEVPDLSEDDDFNPVVDFGEPEETVRKREQSVFSRQHEQEAPQPPATNGVDLSAMLRNLQQQQQPQTQTNQPSAFNVGMLNQGQSNTPAQPSILAGIDLQKLLAVSQQFTNLQHGPQHEQPQAPQPQHNTQAPNLAPNLQAILAQMQGGQQNSGLAVGNGNNPNPFPGVDDQASKKNSDAQKKRGKAPIGPDGKPLNYKTQVCSFWQEGKCLKGDACTYRHDE